MFEFVFVLLILVALFGNNGSVIAGVNNLASILWTLLLLLIIFDVFGFAIHWPFHHF